VVLATHDDVQIRLRATTGNKTLDPWPNGMNKNFKHNRNNTKKQAKGSSGFKLTSQHIYVTQLTGTSVLTDVASDRRAGLIKPQATAVHGHAVLYKREEQLLMMYIKNKQSRQLQQALRKS